MKISQMPLAVTVSENDLIPIVQDGENKVISCTQLKGEKGDKGDRGEPPQETLYAFSFADLDGVKSDNIPVLTYSVSKTSTLSKGGVQVNVPAIRYSILLFTGKADLSTGEITALFDIPAKYNVHPTTMDGSSVENAADFTPYAILPEFKDGVVTFGYLLSSAENYFTNCGFKLFSNSTLSGNSKLMGFGLTVTMEFANESIRDAFYNEFTPVLNGITHFCLKYEKHNIQTIESSYIGG